jgi:hypothetical protein
MSIACSKYKVGLITIKYAPILMGLIMYLYTILSYHGIVLPIAISLAGSAIIPSIIIFSISYMFEFCYIHKAFTIYALMNDLCINYNHYFSLGKYTSTTQLISIIIGTILFILLIFKSKMYHNKCCRVRHIKK